MHTIIPSRGRTRTSPSALAALTLLCLAAAAQPALAQAPNAAPANDQEAQAKRRPQMYLTVFNNGYGDDALPKDPGQFEQLVKTLVTKGNFNVGRQDVKLKLTKPVKALIFSRNTGEYEELKQTAGEIGFKLEPGGGALLRFQ